MIVVNNFDKYINDLYEDGFIYSKDDEVLNKYLYDEIIEDFYNETLYKNDIFEIERTKFIKNGNYTNKEVRTFSFIVKNHQFSISNEDEYRLINLVIEY